MLRKRFTQLGLLLLLAAVTTVAIAAPPGGKGGGGKINASLSVTVTPATFSESDAGATGTVTRENSDTTFPLTVTITSSDTSEATVAVPGSVEIPAGEISVEIPANEVSVDFDVIAVDDTVKDGDQQVTISVSATDHSGASTTITVMDDESLPQIVYVPTVIPMPSGVNQVTVNDINDYGVVAGYRTTLVGEATIKHGIIYDPAAETPLIDLHDDLTLAGFDYENWVVASIVGLNDNGLAVGYAERLPDLAERKGIVIDFDADPIRVYDLPEEDQGWAFSYARKVNDNGDILGVYTRNDADSSEGFYLVNLGLRGIEKAYPLETTVDSIVFSSSSLTEPTEAFPVQVVSQLAGGGVMVYSQGGNDVSYLDFLSRPDANDDGDIAAISATQEEIPGKGNKTDTVTHYELFIETFGIPDYVPLPVGSGGWNLNINSSATVLMSRGTESLLYTSEYGLVTLDSLLTTSVADNNGQSSHTHMNNANITGVDGFGQIAYGHTDWDTGATYLIILNPVPLP